MRNVLGQSAFWQVNKAIARHFKCNDTALLLSDLIDAEGYYNERDQLTKDGYFFKTSENIERDVNIAYRKQKKCIKRLKDAGFIETKLTGVPAKLHFRIVQNKILRFINTRVSEKAKQDAAIRQTNNNKEKEYKERIEEEKEKDLPPFVIEAREAVKKSIGNRRKFNSIEELKEEISKQEYRAHLEPVATWQKLADKGAYLDYFAENNGLKEYGGKATWQDDLKSHLASALRYYKPTESTTAKKVSKYYYKVNGAPHKHDNEKLFSMHKRNFPNHIEIIRA